MAYCVASFLKNKLMPRSKIITGIDLGTSAIKILSVLKTGNKEGFEVLGLRQFPSSGIRKGIIIDTQKATNAISFAVKEMEKEIGREIREVSANIGGKHIFSVSSKGLVSVSRADQKISESDISRVLQNAKTFPLDSNKEILEIISKEFVVDAVGGIKDVLHMKGVRLEAEVLAICGFSPYIKNITQCILDAGISQSDLTPGVIAGSRAVLTTQEKEIGVVFIDIGAETTGIAVYEEGELIHIAVFPVGSDNIRNDIAICLKVDIDTAERIKQEFGSYEEKSKKDKKIKIEGDEPIVFTEKSINQIIEARISEIFDLTNKELEKISRKGVLPAGAVLSGGGAKLPKVKELAKKELKISCRIGCVQESFYNDDPSLAVVWGLVLNEEDNGNELSDSSSFKLLIRKFFRSFIP
jgi:cell division protein FtsA